MATGDLTDFIARARALLPRRWFPDVDPVLDGTLAGLGTAWTENYAQIGQADAQTRLATTTGPFLDLASTDFFGVRLPRLPGELDAIFRARILAALLRPRGTRAAVVADLTAISGVAPVVVEPWNIGDCGAWDTTGFAWDEAGCWGDLNLPWQMFVTAYRPAEVFTGIGGAGGWDTPYGCWDAASFPLLDGAAAGALPSDADIYAAVSYAMPAGTIAWTRIEDLPALHAPRLTTEAGVYFLTEDGRYVLRSTTPTVPLPDDSIEAQSGYGITTLDGTQIVDTQGPATVPVIVDGLAHLLTDAGAPIVTNIGAFFSPVLVAIPVVVLDPSLLSEGGLRLTTEDGVPLTWTASPLATTPASNFSPDFPPDFT